MRKGTHDILACIEVPLFRLLSLLAILVCFIFAILQLDHGTLSGVENTYLNFNSSSGTYLDTKQVGTQKAKKNGAMGLKVFPTVTYGW